MNKIKKFFEDDEILGESQNESPILISMFMEMENHSKLCVKP